MPSSDPCLYWHVKDELEFGEIRNQENNKEVIAMFHTKD